MSILCVCYKLKQKVIFKFRTTSETRFVIITHMLFDDLILSNSTQYYQLTTIFFYYYLLSIYYVLSKSLESMIISKLITIKIQRLLPITGDQSFSAETHFIVTENFLVL